ncbi:hypothetical protein LLEC1_03419 [Akanthomyces lecanii]|uniref:Uncharacterized protein n=1 Tax=Cordyceps confragosa TaxID=2714763 RepID=A0A179I4Z7_CORDF|nr:hypothetical protein LLEC1_03419 [Akanthomyces lecanii]
MPTPAKTRSSGPGTSLTNSDSLLDASSKSQFLLYSGNTELFIQLDKAQAEQPANSTYRPNQAPVLEASARFKPLRVPFREP